MQVNSLKKSYEDAQKKYKGRLNSRWTHFLNTPQGIRGEPSGPPRRYAVLTHGIAGLHDECPFFFHRKPLFDETPEPDESEDDDLAPPVRLPSPVPRPSAGPSGARRPRRVQGAPPSPSPSLSRALPASCITDKRSPSPHSHDQETTSAFAPRPLAARPAAGDRQIVIPTAPLPRPPHASTAASPIVIDYSPASSSSSSSSSCHPDADHDMDHDWSIHEPDIPDDSPANDRLDGRHQGAPAPGRHTLERSLTPSSQRAESPTRRKVQRLDFSPPFDGTMLKSKAFDSTSLTGPTNDRVDKLFRDGGSSSGPISVDDDSSDAPQLSETPQSVRDHHGDITPTSRVE